jgi:outer membrane protein assembly factor BamB
VGADDDTAEDLGSLASALGALAATPMPGRALLARGRVVDGMYRIEDAIGEGGMGVVYRARDVRLDRAVAIKVGTAASAASLARASREALALARLSHPNVVVVYQVGELEGRLYLAMEHVAGGDARAWLRARPRGWREIIALYAGAGDGLAAAHAAGLVHRDFKPDNLLVGDDGRPRVGDFGLAREATSQDGDTVATTEPTGNAITMVGAVVGTPAYMAPEQLAGDDVDARADQFAFCVSLWEALFGARPFRGTEPAELADAIARGDVRAPARADVPPHVIAALRRGLAADRDARWPSMAPLLAELRRDPRVGRRRVVLAMITLALIVGGAGVWAATRDTTPTALPAIEADPNSVVSVAFALGANDGLVEGLAPLDDGDVIVGGHMTPPFAPRGRPVSGCPDGRRCGFVARVSPAGELRWARVIGGDDIRMHGPAVRGDRAVVVADIRVPGAISGVPGASVGEGAFALSLDTRTGAIEWYRRLGTGKVVVRTVAMDEAGAAYVVGETLSPATFEGWTPDSSTDVGYLVALAPDGVVRWGTTVPAGGISRVMGVDVAGGVVAWAGAVPAPNGDELAVIEGVDAGTGRVRWTRRSIGTDAHAGPLAITPDRRVVVAGYVRGTNDFGLGAITSRGEQDGFVAAFDLATGAPRWSRAIGGVGSDNLNAITSGADGDLWIAGRTDGLDATPATLHRDRSDFLVVRLGPDGALRWAGEYGGDERARAKAIAVGATGVWVAGSFTHHLRAGAFALEGTGRTTPLVLRIDPSRAK